MRYYVSADDQITGSAHRMSGDIEASDPMMAAGVFARQHPNAYTIEVWTDFNASTERARRLSEPATPLGVFHVSRDLRDPDMMRTHRVHDEAST